MADIGAMASLADVVNYCDERVLLGQVPDFPGAENGLQVENRGQVTKIGATVDAGLETFRSAVSRGIDFLIVHHGLFWSPLPPIVGTNYEKLKTLLHHNCALYSSHLPLDCHKEIGNNALLAQVLQIRPIQWFLEYEGQPVGLIAEWQGDRATLRDRLAAQFPGTCKAIEFGSPAPNRVALVSGSGGSAIPELISLGVDTLITGELKQEHFNRAQEERLNLYPCGHYATEVFGVRALAHETADRFNLPCEFIDTQCPL